MVNDTKHNKKKYNGNSIIGIDLRGFDIIDLRTSLEEIHILPFWNRKISLI